MVQVSVVSTVEVLALDQSLLYSAPSSTSVLTGPRSKVAFALALSLYPALSVSVMVVDSLTALLHPVELVSL